MVLSDIKKGSRVKVVEIATIDANEPESQSAVYRALELGVVPGAVLSLQQTGPILSDPIALELNGGTIALSRRECQYIKVEEV